jgi:copper(I)-binding protein
MEMTPMTTAQAQPRPKTSHTSTVRELARGALAPLIAAAVVLALLAGWVATGGFGTIARERITVLDAAVAMPSTPGLTAAYLTISDSGAHADELVSVATPDAQESMLMGDSKSAGAGVMRQLTGIAVPAHSTVTLGPYTTDIQLTGLGTAKLKLGGTIPLTLTFRDLGPVTVQARIVAPGTT